MAAQQRPSPLTGRVLAFAHRGGASHPDLVGLENSLTAFRHAWGLGYTHLETDVRLTRDGVVVAIHDDDLSPVTDAVGRVSQRTWDEVRRARIGGRAPVPSFGELLHELAQAQFNIDLKSDRVVPALAALLAQDGAEHRVLVGSFSARRLARFRRATGARVATSAHPGEVLAFRVLPSGRLARLLTRGRVAALQVPHRRGPVRIVTRGFVRRAHAAGVPVHVWTVDDPAEMERLLDLGVDGLMTDRTDLLRDVLTRRGSWSDQDAAR